MFSKLALTDMWIHFFEIFLRQKLSPKKNTSFGFLHQNGKTAQNLSRNWFSDWKPEIPLYMFSKLALTDMWIHFFEIFLKPEISARKNTAFLFLHQNWKTAQNLSSNSFSDWELEIPLSCSVNRLSRTRGSTFLRFFLSKNYLRKKIQLLGFYIKIEKRLKTSQATCFLIKNQKFHYTCSVNRVSRTCGSTFLKFFWSKNYLRKKIQLLGFYIKIEKQLKTSRKTGFRIGYYVLA